MNEITLASRSQAIVDRVASYRLADGTPVILGETEFWIAFDLAGQVSGPHVAICLTVGVACGPLYIMGRGTSSIPIASCYSTKAGADAAILPKILISNPPKSR